MSKNKVREKITRIEAADRLDSLSKQLRGGAVALGDGAEVAVAGEVELEIELKDGELEFELKWQKAKETHPQPVATT